MRTYRVLQTGDWHNDAGNREFVEPAVEFVADLVEQIKPDLVAFTGDAYVHRGAVRPHGIAFNRIAMRRMARASSFGLVAISGNHDQEFRVGMADALTATLSDDVLGVGCDDRIITASVPQIVRVGGTLQLAGEQTDPGDLLSLILVPTPNKYSLHALASAAGVEDPSSDAIATMVEDAIQGMIQEEIAAGRQPAVVFHGTVRGAKLSNEQVMHAGVDVALSTAAFRGAAAGLLGHVHHPQQFQAGADGPPLCYTGSIAPLTWNDARLEPVVYLHTFEVDGAVTRLVDTEVIAVPVASQMIEVFLGAECWEGRAVEDVIREAVTTAQASAGDRVRLAITAPSAVVSQVSDRLLESIREQMGLRSLTSVKVADDLREVRFEAERNIDLLEAARRWAGLRGVADPVPFLDYAATVEQQIVGEHVDAHFEFLPRKLEVRNWYQHADAAIDFGDVGPLVAVTGPNTSGKSNLLRAIPFALYKAVMAGDVLADVVRKGESAASVALEFGSGGRDFRVTRSIKLAASGAATATLFLEEIFAGSMVVPLAEGDAAATELEIQKLVGPLDLFLATSYAGQSDADSLLDLGPAKFRDLLQSVLQRDFAGRVKIASRDGRAAAEERGKTAAARAIYETQAVDVDGLRRQIADRRAIIADLEASLAVDLEPALREQIAAHQATVEDLVARVAAATAAAARHATLRVEIQAAEDRLAQRRQAARDETVLAESLAALDAVDLEAAKATLAAAKTTEAAAREALDRELADRSGTETGDLIARAREVLAAAQAIAGGKADLVAQHATIGPADVYAATEAANTAASKERTAAAELSEHRASPERDQVSGKIAGLRTELLVASTQASDLDREIQRDTREAALISTVPCGGSAWWRTPDGMPGRDGVDMGSCKFLAAASATAAELPAKAARLADLRITATNLQAELSRLQAEFTALTANHDTRLQVLTDRLQAAQTARQAADQDLALSRASVARRQDLVERMRICDAARADVENTTAILVELEARRDRLASERDSRIAGARATHAGACTAVDAAASEVNRAETVDRQRATLAAALDASRIAAADIAAAESELARRHEDLERMTADAAALQESSLALGIARAALSKAAGDLVEFQAALRSRTAQVAEAREQSARLEEQLAAGTRAAEEVGRLTGEIVKLQVREATCSLYEQAVGRDGIPQLLLEQYAVPQLQDLVNRFLAETEFRVAVTTERDKQRGGVATGVFIQFTDSRGRHPMSAASGFQRVALGSALRNALAALHAASTGTLVWISIQDEGFGAYDEANLQAARETLVKMAAGRRWLFFITHVGGLQDIADTRINVVPGPGSSTLTIERNAA